MKKLFSTLAVCFAVGAGASAMQQQQPPTPPAPQDPKPAPQEITLTGCVIQGSGPTVFIFDNAKKDPKSDTEKAAKYVVVAATQDLNLRPHLNHKVLIVGTSDGRTPPMTGKVEEKDLPRFTAKSVTMVADTCTPTLR